MARPHRLWSARSKAISHLARVRRLRNGRPSAIRGCGSFIVTTPPSRRPSPGFNARAFGKLQRFGTYETTVTHPAEFRSYLIEQLRPLVEEYGASIEVDRSAQEIPYPYCDGAHRGGGQGRRYGVRARATFSDAESR